MRIANLISEGACHINQSPARAGQRIVAGDQIDISFDEGAPTAMMPEQIPIEVAYEDEHIIVVVKPSGMLVHPTRAVKSGTLANALAYHLNRGFYEDNNEGAAHGERHSLIRPGLIHRLDRPTSGLMVVAKTQHALTQLSRHFRRRLVDKRYLALVAGRADQDEGSINAPIGRDPERQPQWRVMDEGRAAETRYRVVERFQSATLVEMQPVTGRTNQLRIHSAYTGHPIIGDDQYSGFGMAGRLADPQSKFENPKSKTGPRLCLHAWRIGFYHPAGGGWIEFTSELPSDITSVIESLRARQE
jgi:23S rRNA pseudouridine1911/1915/1917 synthase